MTSSATRGTATFAADLASSGPTDRELGKKVDVIGPSALRFTREHELHTALVQLVPEDLQFQLREMVSDTAMYTAAEGE